MNYCMANGTENCKYNNSKYVGLVRTIRVQSVYLNTGGKDTVCVKKFIGTLRAIYKA